ncbi:MAG: trp operon repressor [Alphaproteobacteria bacterium]|nr:trp operon repressor [Alphaproteobacteria bacterium]
MMANLYKAFSQIKSEQEFNNFLADLCTPSEIKALGERWKIAQTLYNTNLSQEALAAKFGASVTTITRVARFLYTEPFGGYINILTKLFPERTREISKNQKGRLTSASRRHHA